MKKFTHILLSLILFSSLPIRAAIRLYDLNNLIASLNKSNELTANLPKKITAMRKAVGTYRNKKSRKDKKSTCYKLSNQQCLALTLDAIKEALSAFTYPALGKFEDTEKLTPGLSVMVVLPFAHEAKGTKKNQMYEGIMKATNELNGAIDALDVISFLLYPGKDTGHPQEPPKLDLSDEEMDELDDELDDLD